MLYVQEFQNNRLDYLRHHQCLRSSMNQNFSLCSTEYIRKFPKSTRLDPPNVGYPRSQTLFFLSQKSAAELKSTNENQQQTGIVQKNKTSTTNVPKGSTRDDDKQISNEISPIRLYQQVSRNLNGLAKSTTKGNQLSTSFSLPMQVLTEPYRPTTAPLILEENIRRTVSARIKSNTPSRALNPHVVDLTDNLSNFSFPQVQPTTSENDNPFMQESYIDTSSRDHFLDTAVVTNRAVETTTMTVTDQDESKIPHRNSQSKITGFHHIANLGSWSRPSKDKQIESTEKSKEIEHVEEQSYKRIYEYKSPFSEEYDQAISLQAQFPTNNNPNEWNLKDFYRDVKTQFELETNTKPVFEKCLKLSKLQANTIKWEQRRQQNLTIYNRFLKTSTFDTSLFNSNGNTSPNITELKRELRCNECKRISCLGNCAPGQEYHHYKRLVPFSSLPNTREQMRCKLNLRKQRSMIDLRPRTQPQIIRTEQTNLNPIVVVPLFNDEAQAKRPQKKLTNGFLPGRSFHSQRRDTVTLISSQKIYI